MAAVRFLVRGKVQGVWFRAWTEQQATQLGLGSLDGRVTLRNLLGRAALQRLQCRHDARSQSGAVDIVLLPPYI